MNHEDTQALDLSQLDGWKQQDKELIKVVTCDDFSHAMDFVTHVADLAEEHDHHPTIEIRFNIVTLRLSTHDAGTITDKDVTLAAEIDQIAV